MPNRIELSEDNLFILLCGQRLSVWAKHTYGIDTHPSKIVELKIACEKAETDDFESHVVDVTPFVDRLQTVTFRRAEKNRYQLVRTLSG